MDIMLKYFFITTCLLYTFGCQMPKQYTIEKDYVEESGWDREQGIVKNYESSVKIQWKNWSHNFLSVYFARITAKAGP